MGTWCMEGFDSPLPIYCLTKYFKIMDTTKIFKNFLKELGIKNVYKQEIKRQWGTDAKIKEVVKGLEPYEVLDHSFHWAKTEQGHLYWSVIENKWLEYVIANM